MTDLITVRRDERGLTWRDWRWLWAWKAVSALAIATLAVPLVVLYFPACSIVWAFGAFGGRMAKLHVCWHNRDLARKHGHARAPGAARPDGWLP
jgi:hypothetical protein